MIPPSDMQHVPIAPDVAADWPYLGPVPVASSETILQVAGLTKVYGKRMAVNSLNLHLQRGEVFGFLGPNGAGKTTTIRMLLNLIRPTAGEVRLFGEELHRPGAARRLLPRVGAVIEQPSFQSYLTGRDNLIVVGGYTGGVALQRVDEMLDLVGLGERGNDRYSTYSLGMRQRLGLAAALLTDPELIILDEPANGLDPAGIVELRDLIRQLRERGKTIFISSHILAEIRQVCTRIGIVRAGELVMTGPVDELLRATSRWEIACDHPEQVRELLAGLPGVLSVRVSQGLVSMEAPEVRGRQIIAYLTQHGIWPDSVRLSEEDLEHIFLRLTEREAGL